MIQAVGFILAAVLLFYSVHSGFKYTRMISHIFLGLKYNPPQEELSVSLGEKISILDSSGDEVEAILVEKKDSKRIVIFCHDSGSTKASWEKYAFFLPAAGYTILSVDLTMREKDPAVSTTLLQWPIEEEVERVLLAVRWAKKAWSPGASIFLFGVSKGADLAFAASFRDSSIKAVITDGLFSMKEIFRDYIRRWAPVLVKPNLFGENYPEWVVKTFTNLGFWYSQKKSGKKFIDVEKLFRKKSPPLLLIHGEEDDYISKTHQKLLHRLEKTSQDRRHLVVPNARHNEAVSLDGTNYKRTILDFLEKAER